MFKKDKPAYALFFLIVTGFVFITSKGLGTLQPGDENVYFYMGKLITEGKVPYKDFFYAHPPLHIYLLAVIYKIFGFNIVALKSIPLFSALISSFFIFVIAKKKFGNLEAAISSLIFMFSYSILFNSVFSLGIMEATMLAIIGFYFIFNKNNYYFAGLFFGLAAITRLLALIPICVILLTILLSDRENFIKLSSSFFTIFLIVNIVLMIFFGNNYINSVYKFHLSKNFGYNQNLNEYFDIVKLNWFLFLSALAFIFVKNKKPLKIFAIPSIIYLIFLFILKRLFGFYFIIILPFLAIMSGYSLANLYKQLKISDKAKLGILAVLITLFIWNLAADVSFLRNRGFTGFERGSDLANFINLNSNTNTLLFGDASVAPLLALMTNKKLALDFADTNDQVFSSGIADVNEVLARLKNDKILFVLRDNGLSSLAEVRNFINTNCELLGSFYDKLEGNYIFYRC